MIDRTFHVISWLYIRFWEKTGWWNEIDKIGDCLYISSIPIRENEKNLMDKITKEGPPLMLVVSAVEDYEIKETLPFMDPTRKEEWEKKFLVNQEQTPLKDFKSGKESNIEEIAKVILTIQKHRDKNQSVLVHCKAGRTRSAMIVAVVLAVYDLKKIPENMHKSPRELINTAVSFMEKKRVQVKVHEDVKETGAKIVQIVQDMIAKSAAQQVSRSLEEKEEMKMELSSKGALLDKVDELFSNKALNFKDEILKLDACHSLYSYRNILLEEVSLFGTPIRTPKRTEHIKKIFDNLRDAKDNSWLKELILESGPIYDFINANPWVADKDKAKREREKLIEKLKNDVQNLICINLKCTEEELSGSFKKQQNLCR